MLVEAGPELPGSQDFLVERGEGAHYVQVPRVFVLVQSPLPVFVKVGLLCKDLSNTGSVTFAFLAVGLNLLPRISK